MTIHYTDSPRPLTEHQYAVIDRPRMPELPQGWPSIELVSPMLAPQAHLYPWLVPLYELPPEEKRSLMQTLSQHSDPFLPPKCALLLSSPCPVQVVRSALISALYFRDKQQNGHILRYYDPRVLFHLHWMLTPWQLAGLLSARETPYWTFWLEGEWYSLAFPERVVYQQGESVDIPLEQLQRIGQINQVLQKLPRSTDMAQRQETSRRTDALLEQAVTCGLSSQEDRIAFAQHGLMQGDRFWAAPAMAALLARARRSPDYYRHKTRHWDENRWQEMTWTGSRNTRWSK